MRRPLVSGLLVCALAACSERCKSTPAVTPDADSPAPIGVVTVPPGFLKGQLHAHSSESEDSNTPPAIVHRWYERRGFDFVVFTDHNTVTVSEAGGRTLTFPGIELTKNLRNCDPPPPPGFPCALHMNVFFVDPAHRGHVSFGDPRSVRRRDVYLHEIERAKALGGIAMLNHPNLFFSGPDEATLIELARAGLTLVEIANEAWDSDNAGDDRHPSTEALWDAALTKGARLFATATDDAHHYDDAASMRRRGERPYDGDHGFVVVRASERTRDAIRSAIVHGDFYASTGVVFDTFEASASSLTIAVKERLTFEVIAKGAVVRREEGTRLEVQLGPDDGPYLRVRVRRADGARAWTQPLFH